MVKDVLGVVKSLDFEGVKGLGVLAFGTVGYKGLMFWAKPGTNERLESSGLGSLEGLFHAHVDLSFAETCILNARLSQLNKFPCIPQR